MTPDQFRHRREALRLSHDTLAELLGVTAADVIRCERAAHFDPFVLDVAMAYAELQADARQRRSRARSIRRWPSPAVADGVAVRL